MYGATFALAVNTMVAALFAASFTTIALSNAACRRALWFGASYGVGMLTPLSLLAAPYSRWPIAFGIFNYVSFSAGLFLMTAALAAFYGRPPRWIFIACLFAASLAEFWLISDWRPDRLAYNIAYQFPFAVAAALSAGVIFSARPRNKLDLTLAGMFAILAGHFVAKSFLAVTFGIGRFPDGYVASTYALVSQSATGILLIAIGLVTLLIVAQSAIADARRAADTDQLTGLLNRRGFDLLCAGRLAKIRSRGHQASVMLLDLDHFKTVNDRFGHAIGDEVLKAFAASLKSAMPHDALVGRMGGEEFVVFLGRSELETARATAESIRSAPSLTGMAHLPAITVSIGVAAVAPDETLSEALRRADKALYAAKDAGRNRVRVAA